MLSPEQARQYEKLCVESVSARVPLASEAPVGSESTLGCGTKCVFEPIEALAFASEGSRAAS
jgi:hypothetical protein